MMYSPRLLFLFPLLLPSLLYLALCTMMLLSTQDSHAITNNNVTLLPTENTVRVNGLSIEQINALAQLTALEMRSALSVVISNTFPSDADFVIYVVGDVEFAHDHISFVPAQPLNPQQEYYLTLSLIPIGEKLIVEEKFTLATLLTGDEPTIVHVTPGSTQVPANLQHFDVIFSEPMNTDIPNGSIQILNAQQEPLSLLNAFMQLRWSDNGRRLTITLPNQPNSTSNMSYKSQRFAIRLLQIKGTLRNQLGEPIRRDYQKPFYVLPIDLKPPVIKSWAIDTPKKDTKEGFEIHFDEPLNLNDLQTAIKIYDSKGNPVAGKPLINHLQLSWHFIPNRAWKDERYQVRLSHALGDLAGNTISNTQDVRWYFTPE
ncbi:Ig-like domain-containing domain [Aurantivibrio plasticivorans]